VGPTISVCNQPKTLEERRAIAQRFVKKHDYQLPLVLDGIDNCFMKTFAAWPIRYYVIRDGKVAFKAQPSDSDFTYCISELGDWLATNA